MTALSILSNLAALALAVALCCLGLAWRSPVLASLRPSGFAVVLALSLGLAGWSARKITLTGIGTMPRLWALAILALSAVGGVGALAAESQHQQAKSEILATDPQTLQRIGRHLIAGYTDHRRIRELIEARAVSGVFITKRNIGRRSAKDVADEIASWQKLRREQGLPPLIIAADQEGGDVSRLSPPLPQMPPLARVIAQAQTDEARRAAARDYGLKQGRELARLGVTLNFAPVVDLNYNIRSRADAHTRIYRRAIGRAPALVSPVADAYCQGLAAAGVACTLKHFPGLGRVAKDTHVAAAKLATPAVELEQSDWVPFRQGPRPSSTLIMVGHVHLASVDPENPASRSRKVVNGIIRQRWKHDGLLVTDDLSMRAAYAGQQRWGLGATGSAAVAALNAGVDLVLISFDSDQIYSILSALMLALRDGRLDAEMLAASDQRLSRP